MADKSNEYAIDDFSFFGDDGVFRRDPLRLLDIGNDIQMGMSKLGAPTETERATSNFEKLTENKRRPFSHTLTDATRLIPDLIAIGRTLHKTGLPQKAMKKISEKSGKDINKIASNLVDDMLFDDYWSKSPKEIQKKLLSPDELRYNAQRYGINEKELEKALSNKKLYEIPAEVSARHSMSESAKRSFGYIDRRPAISKISNKLDNIDDISDIDILDAIKEDYHFRKVFKQELDNIDNSVNVARSIGPKSGQQAKIDLYKKYLNSPESDFTFNLLNRRKKALTYDKKLEDRLKNTELKELVDKKSLRKYNRKNMDRESIKENVVKLFDTSKPVIRDLAIKTPGIVLNSFNESPIENTGEVKANYYKKGLSQDPVLNMIRSVFNMDYSDPARFNENEIEAYWKFLKDKGQIDPKLKDITPRQKVSLIQGIVKDRPELIDIWKREKGNYLKEKK